MYQRQQSKVVFLQQLDDLIEENMFNEKFGVSELAEKLGMSRSNLLKKVKKASKSCFMRDMNALKKHY